MINQLPAMGFTILKDPDESARKDNIKKKEFLAIETFTGSTSGATSTTVIVIKKLQMEGFEHLGIAYDDTKF